MSHLFIFLFILSHKIYKQGYFSVKSKVNPDDFVFSGMKCSLFIFSASVFTFNIALSFTIYLVFFSSFSIFFSVYRRSIWQKQMFFFHFFMLVTWFLFSSFFLFRFFYHHFSARCSKNENIKTRKKTYHSTCTWCIRFITFTRVRLISLFVFDMS